jgi:tetratricopeptide (TPR) repeat protein
MARSGARGALASGLVAVAALSSLVILEAVLAPQPGSPPAAQAAPAGVPQTYDEALARIDRAVKDAADRAMERRGEWLIHEAVARAYLGRAKLTGSFADYAKAEDALRTAFAVADAGVGPHMTAALLHLSLHRLDAAAAMLDRVDAYAVPPARADQAELLAMRGDIAFYRGKYTDAMRLYQRSEASSPGAADFRMAIYHSKMGSPERADTYLLRAAEGQHTPQSRAFLELHRGVLDLDRGGLDEALAHFRTADKIFPGFWLVQEHIAEVDELKGNLAGAARLYRHVVDKTGHPEFMDRLADIAAARDQSVVAEYWRAQAWREWQKRLRIFPEAAYGHALDHCISKADRACALKLATLNMRTRPYGEAKLKLAQALMMNGRKDDAKLLVTTVAQSGWALSGSENMLRNLLARR